MLFPRRLMFGTLVFERALQVLLLAAVIFICNNERGENHYYLARATQDIVLAFNKTSTRADFWTWCDHTLLSRLFFTTWYNGRATDQDDYNRYTTNPDLFRIGQVRLKQVRVVPGQCRTPTTMAAILPECNVEYSTSNEDRGNYGENWTNMTSNTSTENTYWRYFTQTSYFDPPLYGQLAVYWGGGYVVNLGTSKEEGERIVSYLHRHGWLDRYTRAVMVEFTVYNANVNLFLATTLLVEYSHVGSAFHWISLHPFRLHDDIEGLWSYVTLSVNVFYVFLVFLETVTIGVRMYQDGKKFVRDFWNMWEVFAWMCSAAAVGVFCWRYYLAGNVLAAIPADVTGQFLSFRQVSLCDCVLWYLLAGSVFTNTVRLLQLLAFSSSVAMLTDVIRQSTQHVVVFSVLVMLVFLAFMFCGYLLFGATLQHFQSPLGALLTGFGMLLGSIAFNDIIQADGTLGRLYIFGFVVCLLFVLMNLFVGILNDTISQVKNSGRRENVEEPGLSDLVRMIRQVLSNGGEAVPDKTITVVQNVNDPRDHTKWGIRGRQVFPKVSRNAECSRDIMADLYTPQIYRLLHRVELLQRHVRELQKTFTMWDYFLAYLQSINYMDYIFTLPTDVYYDDSGDSMDYDLDTLLMADPVVGGLQQPCPWQNANIPAVLTVRGNIGDADLPHRLNAISTWLQQMAQKGHQEVVLNTPPPISMTGPPLAPGLPSTAIPQFPQQSPQGVPRPAWATSPGGQVTPGEGMIPGQFSPVGNIRPPTAAQVPAFSFTAQQMGPQNRMPMPSPGGFVRPPQDQLPFRPEQVTRWGLNPKPLGSGLKTLTAKPHDPTHRRAPRAGWFSSDPPELSSRFPPGFHPDGSSGFPGNQGPPGPMQGQMLPSMQVRGGATRLPVHHLLHNAGLAQSAGGGDPNLQGRDVTQSSPLLVNLLQNDISGNANISLAISRTTQSLMQGNANISLAISRTTQSLMQGNANISLAISRTTQSLMQVRVNANISLAISRTTQSLMQGNANISLAISRTTQSLMQVRVNANISLAISRTTQSLMQGNANISLAISRTTQSLMQENANISLAISRTTQSLMESCRLGGRQHLTSNITYYTVTHAGKENANISLAISRTTQSLMESCRLGGRQHLTSNITYYTVTHAGKGNANISLAISRTTQSLMQVRGTPTSHQQYHVLHSHLGSNITYYTVSHAGKENANISLAISRTTQSLMQQGGMQGNLQQQLAMLQQSGLLPQARQRNKSNQQADAAGLHTVPPLPSPQSAMSGSPALSAGSPALSASPNMSASPSMAGAGGMASPSTQHFPSAPSPSIQQGFPSTSSPSLPQGFPRNSSPAVQNNFPTTSSPAVPPNYPSTSSPAVPPNFPPTSSPAVPPNFPPSSSPMQPGFPPSSSPAMQLPTSTASMPPGFPPTSASGVPPGFPPSSGAQPHFQPPSSVAMQQPGFPGMPAHTNMPQQHQNFPNNPSPSFPQAMPGSSPMHTPFSNSPSPTMQQNLPRTSPSQSQPPLPPNFQGPFPNRPPQPGMQQFSNPSQMFPNLPPNAQFPNMSQRFPNPSQQPFPSQQQQFSNMSQQRFPPSSSPNFQSPFPNTSSPNASMAAFINQMQNSAAKAAMSNNANVPPHVLNMREGGRGMNEGPSPLASLSNQVGQVPQPPMPPGMGQQRSPGPNKQQAMPPGGVKDVPFDPPTSAHSFLQGQAEFQSAFLRYVQSQQRQPPPRGGRRGSPGAATSPGLAGLGPRGAPPRAPQPGQTFPPPGGPGPSPGSASPHQPTMEPPLGPGAMPSVSMGPNNGTPNVPDNPSPASNTTTPPVEATPQNMGHPSMGPPQGPNGPAQPPPVTTAPSLGPPPGTAGPPTGTATPPIGTAGPTIRTSGPPLRTAGLPPGTAALTPGTAGPAIGAAAQGLRTATPTPGTAGPALRSAGLSPRLASPMPHSSSPTAGKTPGPGTSQQNQSVPDLSSMNQSQPDQTGKSGPSGDNTASQTPGETTQSQLQGPGESLGGNGTASNVAAEPDNIKAPGSIAQQSVTHEKAGAEEQASSPSVPPEVQGNGKTPCTASQVDPQPDGTGTGQDKPEGEGGSMGEGVSKGGAQEDTAPPQDSGSEMSASEGGGGGKGETVGMATEVVATPSNQEESIPVSSTETPCSTGGPVQSGSEVKQTLDVQQENTTTEAGNKDLPPAADDKKGEEKTPEVPTSSQEQTAKKRELPKDLEEKGPSPLKQSKS
ncbi:hypothetical protein Bbelb_277710 [Branchiostoma belcheri]|nr:hypothetical protein Bbelb_277710 [Branchiostoma belcheri]